VFLDGNLRKARLKIVSVQIVLPQVSQKKTWTQFEKSSMKTEGWQMMVWNRPMNYKGGLKILQISVKFVPRMFTDEQKQSRVFVCQEHLDEVSND
jgi:hypothetical protein